MDYLVFRSFLPSNRYLSSIVIAHPSLLFHWVKKEISSGLKTLLTTCQKKAGYMRLLVIYGLGCIHCDIVATASLLFLVTSHSNSRNFHHE